METYLYFVQESHEKIWGLTPSERIKKVLGPRARQTTDLSEVPEGARVLIFRGDYIPEDRIVKYLAESSDTFLYVEDEGRRIVVAASASSRDAQAAAQVVEFRARPSILPGFKLYSPESLPVSFFQKLRKYETPFVLPVKEGQSRQIEDRIFDWSYKGITDLVTKWLWPAPAKAAVRFCVRHGIRPNHVTILSLILVIIAGWLFYSGHFGLGLLAGWIMTFLDTVDGKLARVTVTSSRFGHYFDHLIDLFHPPIWYILWGSGLIKTGSYLLETPISDLYWKILIWYVIGRLCEGFFMWFVGRFGIFCWRPIDSFFRLITARRNPCLILLTIFWLGHRPDMGLYAVAVWTQVTSLFLLLRLVTGLIQKKRGRQPRCWLEEVDQDREIPPLARRWFVRRR